MVQIAASGRRTVRTVGGVPFARLQFVSAGGRRRKGAGANPVAERGVKVAVPSRRGGLRYLAGILLVLVALSGDGCSFVVARRPPPYYAVPPTFECTKSVAPAVVDTTLATMYAALTVGDELARTSGRGAWFVGAPWFSVLLGVHAAIYGASAAWGFYVVGECREALRHSVELDPGWFLR